MVEGTVVVVDPATDHRVSTGLPGMNDSRTIGTGLGGAALKGSWAPMNTRLGIGELPAASRVATILSWPEARVAHTAIPVQPNLLKTRQRIKTTTQLILATACHSVASWTLHVVPVPDS